MVTHFSYLGRLGRAGFFRPRSILVATFITAFLAGCGGSGSSLTENTTVTLLAAGTANDQMTEFNIQVTGVTLTSQSGKTVNLSTAQLYPEFIHLNGIAEPLATAVIPQDIYTSAAVTLGSAAYYCAGFSTSSDELQVNSYIFGQVPATAVTVNVPAPITVSGTSMGIALDLLASQSASDYTCSSTNATSPVVSPTFDLTPVTIAAEPSNSSNGRVVGLHGMVSSIGTSGTSFSVAGADGADNGGPSWQVISDSATVFQGVSGFSQLSAGMPVDMDATIQPDGPLLATRVAVYDTDTTDLNVFTGPVLLVFTYPVLPIGSSQPDFNVATQEQQGYLEQFGYYSGDAGVSSAGALFQISGGQANLQNLPFVANFSAASMTAGQEVSVTSHVSSYSSGFLPATTVTLMPQTVNGTVSAVSADGSFTTYTVALASYDLFPDLATDPLEITTLTNPGTVVVYADSNTQLLNSGSVGVGGVFRFYGLVFNDNGTLRMDCAQISDGVAE